jgi:hypothetical protein
MSPAEATRTVPAEVSDERLDALFHGPLEEFTPARDALAKELRADGYGEAADWVKGLKKPTRAAWLVNQLSARKRAAVERLLEVGEELRELHEGVLTGSVDRDRLRKAAQAEQRAISELVNTAEAIGREHQIGSQVLDRVAETLQAATSDPEVAEEIDRGHLQREVRSTSLGIVGDATAPPARGRAKGKAGDAAERRGRQQAARRRQATESKLDRAERKVERERAAVEKAQEALEERGMRLHEAEREAAAARRELESHE